MKKIAFGLIVLATACQPRQEANLQGVTVTDAVLTRQSTSEATMRSGIPGTWLCTGVASGLDMSAMTTYRADGGFDESLKMNSPQVDLKVDVKGKWTLSDAGFQQTFTETGAFTGTVNGGAVTPDLNTQLSSGFVDMKADPEVIDFTPKRFTLTDGQGTVTTCVR